jgi:hypothetical protein
MVKRQVRVFHDLEEAYRKRHLERAHLDKSAREREDAELGRAKQKERHLRTLESKNKRREEKRRGGRREREI